MRSRSRRALTVGLASLLSVGLLVAPPDAPAAAASDPGLPDPVVSNGAPWQGTITEVDRSDTGSNSPWDAGPAGTRVLYTGASFLVDGSWRQSCSSSVSTRITTQGQGVEISSEAWELPVYWQARGTESCSGGYTYAETYEDLLEGRHRGCSYSTTGGFALDTAGDEPLRLDFSHNTVSSWSALAFHTSDNTWTVSLSDGCGQLSIDPRRIALSTASSLEAGGAVPFPDDVGVGDLLTGTSTYTAMDRPAVNGWATWHLTYNGVTGPATPTVVTRQAGEKGHLGAVCGKATFRWRQVTLEPTNVKDGEPACVFLVGNELARQVLTVAVKQGVPLGKAFAGTILRELTPEVAPKIAAWGAKWTAKKVLLDAVAKSVGARAGAFTPLTTMGTVVGLNAVPLAGLFVTNQIKNNDACIQVVVDVDGDQLNADWSMVYAHSSDPMKTRAKVYRKKSQLGPDTAKAVPLQMRCQPSGKVEVMSTGTKALSHEVTTLFKVRR